MKYTDDIISIFDGWEETMIWSCLQGHMGRLLSDGKTPARSAMITVGDFCFLGGIPNDELIRRADAPICLVPQNALWEDAIEHVCGANAKKATRYAIKKEPDIFNREKLSALVNALPEHFTLSLVTSEIYDMLMAELWSRDFCSLFKGYEDYKKRGLGIIALENGLPVAGASSYSIYSDGIEIEIDTKPDYRRQGLASACGARLILECLERSLYPSWDAHDLRSVALAEKLGYHRDKAYTVYELHF